MTHRLSALLPNHGFLLPILLVLVALAAIGPASSARADYTVTRHYMHPIGTGGTLVWNQSTVLDTSDMVSAWNYWTGTSYLSTTTNPSTCGSSKSCVYVMNEGASIGGCYAPTFADAEPYAATYLEAYPEVYNLPCGMGSPDYPVYIVVLNSSESFDSTELRHIRRHEMGHALQLADTTTACWEGEPGVWYPLMHNVATNCSGHYTDNGTPSDNEKYYAEYWSFN